MAFEVVVRPVIFPNIRPAKVQQPPNPPDDPNADQCVITGSSGKSIDLPYSWSVSMSQSKRVETKRRVDVARVYQKEDDGTVNKDNFVDVEVANKIWYRGGAAPTPPQSEDDPFAAVPHGPIVTTTLDEQGVIHVRPIHFADNIEIKEKDVIRNNPIAGTP
jgi:hypothetical protein